MGDKIIYRLDDEISFRKCSLFDECSTDHGDCTNFHTKEVNIKPPGGRAICRPIGACERTGEYENPQY